MAIYYLDTETTGLYGPAIEVAIVSDGYGELNTLIKTGVPIEAGAQAVHGITQEEVDAKGVSEAEAGRMVYGLLKNATMVCCHNVAFDKPRVERLFEAARIPMPSFTWHCTLKHARELIPGRGCHKLGDLKKRFNIPDAGNAHRALADAVVCKHIFWHLTKDIVESVGVKCVEATANSTPLKTSKMWLVGPAVYWQTLYTKNDSVLGPQTELKTFEVRAIDFKRGWLIVIDVVKCEERCYRFDRFNDACIVDCMVRVLA